MTSDLLPEFSFRHSAHDRLSDRRGDASFLETAWDDASTRVVLIRDQDLAVSDDGVHVATLSPAQAPPGQRMLLGAADGVVHFLVVESTPDDDPAGDDDAPAGQVFRPLREVATTLSPLDASLAVHAVALTGTAGIRAVRYVAPTPRSRCRESRGAARCAALSTSRARIPR